MKTKGRKTLALCLALITAAALLLVGCKKKEAEKEPIKIGAIFSVTGPVSFLGAPEGNTAEMLVEKFNADGGVLGHPIELIIKDDQANPEKTLSFAKQLIEEEKVLAIVGPSGSGNTMAIKDVCEENETILISCAAAEEIVNPLAKWVFKTPQKDSFAAQWDLKTMQEMGIKRIGIVAGSTGFGNLGTEQLKKYAPDYGIEIAIAESYSVGEADFTGVLNKVKAANVEAVVNWSVFPAQSIVPKNMAQMGFDVPLFCSHGFGNIRYVETAGMAAEGIIFPCGKLLAAEELPRSDKQKKVLMEYKEDYESRFGEEVSTFGGHAYDALMVLVEAIEKAKSVEKEKVREAIENLTGFVGTAGIFSFSPTEHNGLDMDSLVMYTVKDGKFVLLE